MFLKNSEMVSMTFPIKKGSPHEIILPEKSDNHAYKYDHHRYPNSMLSKRVLKFMLSIKALTVELNSDLV